MSEEDASYNSDLPPSSSEDEGDDGGAAAAPPPPMRGRRQGVSAEISQSSQEEPKAIASHAKSAEDSQFLLSSMTGNSLFSHLSTGSMNSVIGAFFLVEKADGEVVMQQGSDGDNFYVIQEGSVKILVNGNQVATKAAGGSFGELALMYNAPRTATVVCDGRAKLWALDRTSFQAIMRSTESSRNSTVADFLCQMDLFKSLSKEELAKIVDAVQQRDYKDGEYMFRQGDAGEDFFIISQGNVTVTKSQTPGAAAVPVAQLGAGKFFGELALSMNQPRAASVFANGDCSCFTLDRGSFERLLGPVSEVLGREKTLYLQQDIRSLKDQVRILEAELAAAKASSIQSIMEEPLSLDVPADSSEALKKSIEVMKGSYADAQQQLKLLVERLNATKEKCKSMTAKLSS